MQIKHLCATKGFKSKQTTMNAMTAFNAVILFGIAIPYWSKHEFYPDLFWIGFVGGAVSCLAISLLN